jgi:hypothetical protein
VLILDRQFYLYFIEKPDEFYLFVLFLGSTSILYNRYVYTINRLFGIKFILRKTKIKQSYLYVQKYYERETKLQNYFLN